jgi:hypothetical protein
MRHFQPSLALLTIVGAATAVAPAVRADTGVQVGVRSGVQLLDDDALRHDNALSVGAEARLSFALSPLIVALTFDHFFVEDRTLFQVGAAALYDLPIGHAFLYGRGHVPAPAAALARSVVSGSAAATTLPPSEL